MFTSTLRKKFALVSVLAVGLGLITSVSANAAAFGETPVITRIVSGDTSLIVTFTSTLSPSSKWEVATDGATFADTGIVTLTDRSFTVTGLTNGSTYTVKVRGVNSGAGGNGAASSSVTAIAGLPDVGTLFVSKRASSTGAAITGSGVQDSQYSLGWVTKTSTNGTASATAASGYTLTSSAAATGVVYAGSKIAFAVTGSTTSADAVSVVVSGGTLSGVAATTAITTATVSLNGATTTAVSVQGDTNPTTLFGVLNVSAAAGSTATISAYEGTGIAGTSTATNGALVGTWTFTVAAASAAGTVSLPDSTVTQQAGIAKGVAASTTTAYDTTTRMDNGQVGLIYLSLNDAYGSAVTTGTFAASATAGTVNAVVAGSAASGDAYAATTGYDTVANSSGAFYVYVNQPVANTAASSTVTMTLNGVVVGTKTLNWNGDIASLAIDTVNSNTSFANGATATSPAGAEKGIVYIAKDAAGNVVTLSAQPTVDSAAGALLGATVYTGNNGTSGDYQTIANGYGDTTLLVPASSLVGAGSFRLKLTNSAGAAIYSQTLNATVSNGSTYTFKAAWDKSSYAPGEIAILKITALDSKGNPMAAGTALAGLTAGLAVSTAGFTALGTACTDASVVDSTGSKTCKFAAGNTEGSYSYSVGLTNGSAQSAVIGTLPIKATSATVTNAEVLAAIVKLIASINKQIAALQKALKK